MKFLADQDVYAATVSFLKELGHDPVTASQLNLSQATDISLLQEAQRRRRILITRDRDFGALVIVKSIRVGVIYRRALPKSLDAMHRELQRVLGLYSEDQIVNAFIVVQPERHRIRKLPAQ